MPVFSRTGILPVFGPAPSNPVCRSQTRALNISSIPAGRHLKSIAPLSTCSHGSRRKDMKHAQGTGLEASLGNLGFPGACGREISGRARKTGIPGQEPWNER